jgi:hypothetical protein
LLFQCSSKPKDNPVSKFGDRKKLKDFKISQRFGPDGKEHLALFHGMRKDSGNMYRSFGIKNIRAISSKMFLISTSIAISISNSMRIKKR